MTPHASIKIGIERFVAVDGRIRYAASIVGGPQWLITRGTEGEARRDGLAYAMEHWERGTDGIWRTRQSRAGEP